MWHLKQRFKINPQNLKQFGIFDSLSSKVQWNIFEQSFCGKTFVQLYQRFKNIMVTVLEWKFNFLHIITYLSLEIHRQKQDFYCSSPFLVSHCSQCRPWNNTGCRFVSPTYCENTWCNMFTVEQSATLITNNQEYFTPARFFLVY